MSGALPTLMGVTRDIVLLGSTGSVGTQALDVVRRNPDRFRVVGLAAGGDRVEVLARQALEFGVEDLQTVPVLGHRCDNPLCQRTCTAPDGSVHVQRSSPHQNAREWASRRHAYGNPLRDSRGSRGRARTIRDLLRSGATGADLAAALGAGLLLDAAQLQLWEDEPQPAGAPTVLTGEDELLDAGLVGAAR